MRTEAEKTAALEAIASFPEANPMAEFSRAHGVYYHEMEPPYLTMARIALWAMGKNYPTDSVIS